MKIVLSNKKEVVKLLNDLYKLKNTENEIKEAEIEECSTNFITKEFKTREADILYKIKNRNIFFLIEHQSKIDYSMSYRIFEYSKEIIDRAIDKEIIKNRKYKMPVVYPIVIYKGKRKWNAEKTMKEIQETFSGIERKDVGEYELVDVNNYTEEELIKGEGILSKVMLIEKSRTKEDFIKKIKKLAEENYTKEEKEILEKIIYHIFLPNLDREELEDLEEIIKKLEERKEKKEMLAVEEMLRKSYKKEYRKGRIVGRKEGRLEGQLLEKRQIVLELLRRKVDKNFIMEVAGVTEEELRKIKDTYGESLIKHC